MRAAVISMRSKSSMMTIEAMRKYFSLVDDIDIRNIEIHLGDKKPIILYNGKPFEQYDCIYAKGSFRFTPLLRTITAMLHKTTYFPIKPSAFNIGHDKLLTQLTLETNDVPMPKTYLAPTPDTAKRILQNVNYPIIMKFPEGTQGKGVMYADTYASASSILDALNALRQPFIIQEYIETGGTDTRAFVVGDKVVAAMKRHAVENEKRANIHAGGKGRAATIDENIKTISIKAAKAVGAEICGIDLLEGTRGPLVIEVNISPGLQGITEASGIDVADMIAKFLHDETEKFKNAHNNSGTKKIMQTEGLEGTKGSQEIIMSLDFRNNRILLPAMMSRMSGFSEGEEVTMKSKKGKIEISKL